MNKEEITKVLQVALFWMDREEPKSNCIEPHFVQIGKKLAEYLQELDIQENKREIKNE